MSAGTKQTAVGSTAKYDSNDDGACDATIHHLQKWKITAKAAINRSATNSNAGWKGATVGTKEWEGSLMLNVHDGEASPLYLGQRIKLLLLMPQTTDGSGDPQDNGYTGFAVVEELGEIEVDIDSGKEITHEYKIKGDGALTVVGDAPPLIAPA
jgi:hypothetical protein